MSSYIELNLGGDIHPTIRIEYPKTIGSIDVVLSELIKPALLASGYQEGTVNKVVVLEDEE